MVLVVTLYQCSGSVTVWYGSGFADPYLWLTDPDPDPNPVFFRQSPSSRHQKLQEVQNLTDATDPEHVLSTDVGSPFKRSVELAPSSLSFFRDLNRFGVRAVEDAPMLAGLSNKYSQSQSAYVAVEVASAI